MLVGGALPVYPWFHRRGPRGGVPPNVLWAQWFLQSALRITGGRLRVTGEPPREGLVLCNHLSYVDIAVLGSAFPCAFVSKVEVRAWPFIGWGAVLAGTVFVRRARRREVGGQVDDLKLALTRRIPIILFPEGTSTDGTRVLPFRSALLQAAQETDCNVTPAALSYRTASPADAARDICWWGGVAFAAHLWRFLALPKFETSVVFGSPRSLETDRKSEAAALREEVLGLLRDPWANHDAPPTAIPHGHQP